MKFTEKLRKIIRDNQSILCVGLDPVPQKLPEAVKENTTIPSAVSEFCKQVITATQTECSAYKPNLAFFEALGTEGFTVLKEVCDYIPDHKIIIADAKRGDITTTGEQYCKTYFEWLDVDAVTINPLMGFDTLEPFRGYPGKALFVLTLTSNPGAADFLLKPLEEHPSIASYISDNLKRLSADFDTHLGMVTGATQIHKLEEVIRRHPTGALLIPGIGKQGGDVEGLSSIMEQLPNIPLINSSRSIIYAGNADSDWQEEVHNAAKQMKKQLKPLTDQYV